MRSTFTILLFITFMPFCAQAQMIGASVQVGIPNGEFKESTNAIGAGLNINALFPFDPRVPIYFGLDFGYMLYGSNQKRENLEAEIRAGNVVLDRIQMPLSINTNNNLLHGHAILRFKAPFATVQPYIDGAIGFKYFYTRTKILDESDNRRFSSPDNNVINAKTNLQDFVLSYGGGGGFQMNITNSLKIDLRVLYLLSGEAEYFDRDDTQQWDVQFTANPNDFDPDNIQPEDIDVSVTPKKSRTDMFFTSLGITFEF